MPIIKATHGSILYALKIYSLFRPHHSSLIRIIPHFTFYGRSFVICRPFLGSLLTSYGRSSLTSSLLNQLRTLYSSRPFLFYVFFKFIVINLYREKTFINIISISLNRSRINFFRTVIKTQDNH